MQEMYINYETGARPVLIFFSFIFLRILVTYDMSLMGIGFKALEKPEVVRCILHRYLMYNGAICTDYVPKLILVGAPFVMK